MAEPYNKKGEIRDITFEGKEFHFVEQMNYPNGGFTRFFEFGD